MSKMIKMALLLMTNTPLDDSDGNFFFDGSDADDCEDDTLDDRDDANTLTPRQQTIWKHHQCHFATLFQAALTCNYGDGGGDLKHFFSSGFLFHFSRLTPTFSSSSP